MGLRWLALLACLVLLGTGYAWAETLESAKTTGLTNVTVTKGIMGSQYWYEFTLINNMNPLSPIIDCGTPPQAYVVLADRLAVDLTDLLPNPVSTAAPTDWNWSSSGFERFIAEPSRKYYVPPSAAPGSSLSGFKYFFNTDPGVEPNDIKFVTHVLAVDPDFTYDDPPANTIRHYSGVTVCLPGYGQQSTWFDPRCPRLPVCSSG